MRNKKLIILLSVLGGLTLLIILASVIFSVHTVVAYCPNGRNDADDALISAQVVEAADIGFTSIFMLNEDEIMEKVDKNVAYAEMVNVERIFPNKVSLNYNRLYEDIWFEAGGAYCIASTSGKVLKVSGTQPDGMIKVILGSEPLSTEVGTYFNHAQSEDRVALATVIGGLTRFRESITGAQLFNKELYREIDLSGEDVIIKTTSGAMFELRCNTVSNKRASADVMFTQLRVAVTMYLNEKIGDKTYGRYIVPYNHNDSGFYSKD